VHAGAGDRAAVKRAAAKAIAAAGAAELSELGVVREGRSPRYWFEDRGWWRVNVWFAPSSFSVSINLRVGLQYLWRLSPHASMDSVRWGGDGVAEYPTGALDGSAGSPDVVAAAYAREAADRVRRIRDELGEDWRHLRMLAQVEYLKKAEGGVDVAQGFVLGVDNVLLANALLGRDGVCRQVISSHRNALLTDPHRHEPWSRFDEQMASLDELEAIVMATDPRALIAERIDASRALLEMAPMTERPAFLSGLPPAALTSPD